MAFYGRGENKIQDPYVGKDFYKEYAEEVEEGSPYDVSYDTFRYIYEKFYKGVIDHIFDGGLYKLPYNMGEISIKGKRLKTLGGLYTPIDWKATNEIGKKVYHLNDHSNYYKYRLCWSKKFAHTKNKFNYRLVLTRTNKRRLAQIIKSGDYSFFDQD